MGQELANVARSLFKLTFMKKFLKSPSSHKSPSCFFRPWASPGNLLLDKWTHSLGTGSECIVLRVLFSFLCRLAYFLSCSFILERPVLRSKVLKIPQVNKCHEGSFNCRKCAEFNSKCFLATNEGSEVNSFEGWMESVGWWALEGQSWENLVIMTSKSPSFYSRKIKRGYSSSRCHTVRGCSLAQNKLFLWTLTPLFFLLYYYPPSVNQAARNALGASLVKDTSFCVMNSHFLIQLSKSWFSFFRFFKNITATLVLKIMKLQRISIEPSSQTYEKLHVEMNGGFSF